MPAAIPDDGKEFIKVVWALMKEKDVTPSGRKVFRMATEVRANIPEYRKIKIPGVSMSGAIVNKLNKECVEIPPRQKDQDSPWSTATLERYPDLSIEPPTPEALSAVLHVWRLHTEKGIGFSIREAKWTGRLSALIHEQGKSQAEETENLSKYAIRYAHHELIHAILGLPFDSTVLDYQVMDLPYIYDFTPGTPLRHLMDMQASAPMTLSKLHDQEEILRKSIRNQNQEGTE